MNTTTTESRPPVLAKDLRIASLALDRDQARVLVGMRMQAQEHRIALGNQSAAARREEKPSAVLEFFAGEQRAIEEAMDRELTAWAKQQPLGQWMMAQTGIGGVFAAGLLAHVDWHACETASRVWRFAGLDPSVKWGKGEKRPWNAELKRLCWLVGESFKKQSGRESAFYGQLYRRWKAELIEQNDAGQFTETAAADLAEKGARMAANQKSYYERGVLPPGRIDLRATRKAVKMFLSHGVWVATALRGEDPRKPWVIEHGGHVDLMLPPAGGPFEP